ncbi:uncharacterized protein LOC111086154 [Limulus polyphemus]|uniref:Uncharacterized protein LOC111086154 n=1 Tax=Limulus polyphemus TaxID=6850 RepID=A0ABM1SIV8_LIMPO|nr:uncharacterized protein LOC111086154 [Limulus polyphemus]
MGIVKEFLISKNTKEIAEMAISAPWELYDMRDDELLEERANYQRNGVFADTLNSVVLDMTRQYFARENYDTDDFFYDMDHPELEKTTPFFHGFIPGTGYNNREGFLLILAIILDSISFVKTYEQLQILAVVILEASEHAARLTVYTVVNGYSNQAMLLNLDDTPVKIGYVSSHFDSSIILLYHSSFGFNIQYIEEDHIRDLQSFRIGFEHFFAIIASREQHLLVWRSEKFHTKQVLTFPNAIQLHTAPVSSCRDDIVALLLQDTIPNSVSLLMWHSQDEKLIMGLFEEYKKNVQRLSFVLEHAVTGSNVFIVEHQIFNKMNVLHRSVSALELLENFSLEGSQLTLDELKWTVDSLALKLSNVEQNLEDVLSALEAFYYMMKPLIIENSLDISGRINNMDLSEDLVTLHRNHQIKAHKTMKDEIYVYEDLTVKLIDETDIKEMKRFSLTENTIQTMSTKEFSREIYVTGLVDQLNTSDAVTLTLEDFLYDKVFARGIGVEKDVIVGKSVDAVDVSSLTRLIKRKDFHLPGKITFLAGVLVEQNLDVQKKIYELDVGIIYHDAIFKTDDIVEIYSLKAFDALTIKSTTVNTINGFNMEDFMFTGGRQTIRGTKFLDETNFSDLRSDSNIVDEVDLKVLEAERVSRSSASTIQGHLNFFEILLVENAIAETVDGIIIENAVMVSLPQEIVTKIFKPHLADNRRKEPCLSTRQVRVIGDVEVETTVDSVDLTKFTRERITISSNQNILVEVILGDNDAVLIEAERVNNVDLAKLSKNVMSLSKSQVVSEKNFEGEISVFGDIRTSAGVSNTRLDLVNTNAIKLNGNQILFGHLTFLDVLGVAEHFIVEKLINNVNLTHLVEDSVMTGGNHVLTKPVCFQSLLQINGDLDAILVNGFHLPDKLLTRTSPQVITGFFVFERGLGLSSNLFTSGLINGVDVSYLSATTMNLDQNNEVLGNLKFQNEVVMEKILSISGLVNGINLSRLQTEAVLVNERGRITIPKTISNEVFVKHNLTTNVVNNLNLEEFVADVTWIIGEEYIPTSKTFTEEVVVLHNLEVLGPTSVSPIDGIDLARLARDAIYLHQPEKIKGNLVAVQI